MTTPTFAAAFVTLEPSRRDYLAIRVLAALAEEHPEQRAVLRHAIERLGGHLHVGPTELEWSELEYCGTQPGDDETPALELRNCHCGSTRAREIRAD